MKQEITGDAEKESSTTNKTNRTHLQEVTVDSEPERESIQIRAIRFIRGQKNLYWSIVFSVTSAATAVQTLPLKSGIELTTRHTSRTERTVQ